MSDSSRSERAVDGLAVDSGSTGGGDFQWRQTRGIEVASLLAALALHLVGGIYVASGLFELGDFANLVRSATLDQLNSTVDIEAEPPPPQPEPEEKAEEPSPELPPELPPEIAEMPPVEEAPPPAAAEAGKVLTAEPEPDEPLDLTGQGFITGTGTRFAGGVTAATGTSDKAVRNPGASGDGLQGSRGKKDAPVGPPPIDKSRPAGIPKNANWHGCGFPPEADAENINQASVRVVVVVSASGKPTSVSVLSDPGHGFGRLAQQCAMRFEYPVGLDKNGNPKASATAPFNIRFYR